jgi:hypothetical protein
VTDPMPDYHITEDPRGVKPALSRVHSFEDAKHVLETTTPHEAPAWFHRCVWHAPKGFSTRPLENYFEVLDGLDYKTLSATAPPLEALKKIARFRQIVPYSVEIAADFKFEHDASAARESVAMCLVQPWAGTRRVVDPCGGAFYCGQRKPGPHHHLAGYLRGDRVLHLEWRYQSLTKLRTIGIGTTADMLTFDFRQFWLDRDLPLYHLDFERYGMLRSNRRTHRKRRQPLPHRYYDSLDRHEGCVAFKVFSAHMIRINGDTVEAVIRYEDGSEVVTALDDASPEAITSDIDCDGGEIDHGDGALIVTGNSLQRFVQVTGRGRHLQKIDMQHWLDRVRPAHTLFIVGVV